MHPGAVVDAWTRYEDDEVCQRFVSEHPDGATLEEIGAALGVTRQRAEQIEALARRRLVLRLQLVGIDVDDLRAAIARREWR